MSIKINKVIDYVAIIVGIIAIITNLFTRGSEFIWVNYLTLSMATICCIGYISYSIYLISKRAEFDWHLIHGNFLRKVCCLVVLLPSLLTFIGCIFIESPKELSYQEELYEYTDNDLGCDIRNAQKNPNIFWATYFHFIDPGNQHMTTTKAGRIWAALIAILGVFLLNGLLVSSIIGWIDNRKEKWLNGEIRYNVRHLGKNRFAIVIGANEIASSVIKNLFTPKIEGEINYKCEGDNRYVLLHTRRNPVEVRSELSSHISPDQMSRVIIYNGLRDSANEIRSLNPEYATEIYVLGESTLLEGGETHHDAMNMCCVNLLADIFG